MYISMISQKKGTVNSLEGLQRQNDVAETLL